MVDLPDEEEEMKPLPRLSLVPDSDLERTILQEPFEETMNPFRPSSRRFLRSRRLRTDPDEVDVCEPPMRPLPRFYPTTSEESVFRYQGKKPVTLEVRHEHGPAFLADAEGLTTVLLNQFDKPLLCFRETVQNGIDAGATKISITTTYDRARQVLLVTTTDNGTGMRTREHIEQYLTLFESTKDQDITKIGEIGAGKVSTFTLKPSLVVVHTGSEEIGYKLVFEEGFSGKILQTEPHPGTEVHVLLPMTEKKARKFGRDIADVLTTWCPYVTPTVDVNGVVTNQPMRTKFGLYLSIKKKGLEAKIVSNGNGSFTLAKRGVILQTYHYAPDLEAFSGNLLREFDGIVNCDTLTCALSRNGVIRDDNYKMLFSDLTRKVAKQYTPRFLKEMESTNARVNLDSMRNFFLHIIANHGYHVIDDQVLAQLQQQPLVHTMDDRYVSVAALKQSVQEHGMLYTTDIRPSPIEQQPFISKGIPVLFHPKHILTRHIFAETRKQSIEDGYLQGAKTKTNGVLHFDELTQLLQHKTENDSSTIYASQGRYYTRPNYSTMQIYGTPFTDFSGRPEEKVLFHVTRSPYSLDVGLNINHPFIAQMTILAETNPKLAHFYICSELIKSPRIFDAVSPIVRAAELQRLVEQVFDA